MLEQKETLLLWALLSEMENYDVVTMWSTDLFYIL